MARGDSGTLGGYKVNNLFNKEYSTVNKTKNTKLKEKKQLQFRYGEIVPKERQDIDEESSKIISKYTIVKERDIIINGLNLNYDFISQRVAMVRESGIITSAYISLRSKIELITCFYNYFMKAMDSRMLFHGMGSGIRLTLSYDNLKNLFFPYPDIAEQTAIANYLDSVTSKIDEAISQQQKMIDLLNERKQIIIQNAVTKGLDPNAKMKDSGVEWIGEIPENWRLNRFKNLFKTRSGITFTKKQIVEYGESVISYGQIHSKDNYGSRVNPELIRFIPKKLTKNKGKAKVVEGDFLFADTSEDFEGCGNNVYIDCKTPIYAGYHTILAKKNNNEVGQYLAYLFASRNWRGQVRSLVNGVKVYSITQTILKSVYVVLPPIEEQLSIAEYLNVKVGNIDKKIKSIENYISLLQERKQIIINDVVTGKVKVI